MLNVPTTRWRGSSDCVLYTYICSALKLFFFEYTHTTKCDFSGWIVPANWRFPQEELGKKGPSTVQYIPPRRRRLVRRAVGRVPTCRKSLGECSKEGALFQHGARVRLKAQQSQKGKAEGTSKPTTKNMLLLLLLEKTETTFLTCSESIYI